MLKKFQEHHKQKGLILRGNDLRSNVYLKKMEKLARQDLGLDIIGYKDYVNNLKQFADLNTDLTVLARDNYDPRFDKMDRTKGMIELAAEKMREDESAVIERARKYEDIVLIALSKMMRKGQSLINKRDEAAIDDLIEHLHDYLCSSYQVLDKLLLFHRLRREQLKDEGEWIDLHKEFLNVPNDVL